MSKLKDLLEKHWWKWTLLLTAVMELVTCLFRFGFKMQSTRDTKFIAKLTFGIRIHHGYIGILLVIIALLFLRKKTPTWFWASIIVGLSLFLSDIIHHFLVLWPITNSPEFHLVYPPQ